MLVAVITTKLLTLMRADEKLKMIMKLLRFIIILMMHDSDAECSDLYHQKKNSVTQQPIYIYNIKYSINHSASVLAQELQCCHEVTHSLSQK